MRRGRQSSASGDWEGVCLANGTVLSDGRGNGFPETETGREWERRKERSRETAEKSQRSVSRGRDAGSARCRSLHHGHDGPARSHGDRCPPRPARLFPWDGEGGKRNICSHQRRRRSRAHGRDPFERQMDRLKRTIRSIENPCGSSFVGRRAQGDAITRIFDAPGEFELEQRHPHGARGRLSCAA